MGAFTSKPPKAPPLPPKPVVTDIDRAILDLKNSRDRLNKYKKQLEINNNKLVQKAKEAKKNGQNKTAINLLRLRNYQQQQVYNCEEQLLTIQQMVTTIDSKQNDTVILQAMKIGKDTLTKLHNETTVDDILNLFDEIHEQHQLEEEINTVLSQNVPALSVADEDAIEAELNAMMGITTEPTTTEPTKTDILPEVPTEPILPVAPQNELVPPTATSTAEATKESKVAVPA